jgi:hypothetical protein
MEHGMYVVNMYGHDESERGGRTDRHTNREVRIQNAKQNQAGQNP